MKLILRRLTTAMNQTESRVSNQGRGGFDNEEAFGGVTLLHLLFLDPKIGKSNQMQEVIVL